MDEIEIVVPNSLQMGWCESPSFFSSVSETARNMISVIRYQDLPPYPFEHFMLAKCQDDNTDIPPTPLSLIEVYVYPFIAASNELRRSSITTFSQGMLHGIYAIFPPPKITDHSGFDPISEGKLKKGEGTWLHEKEILGWNFDEKITSSNFRVKNAPPFATSFANS